jgi:hypothetical protein
VVNHAEAETVRQIYRRYLKLGSVRELKRKLDCDQIVSKIRVSRKGIRSGGQSFSRGAPPNNAATIGRARPRASGQWRTAAVDPAAGGEERAADDGERGSPVPQPLELRNRRTSRATIDRTSLSMPVILLR